MLMFKHKKACHIMQQAFKKIRLYYLFQIDAEPF
jgi:hypothetical protein